MTWPVLVLWILIIIGMFAPTTFMLYMLLLVPAFGDLSLLPPGLAGNVPGGTICAALLISKTFIGRKRFSIFLNYAMDIHKLAILSLFSVYVVVTAYLYPRIFAGTVNLYALNYASSLSPLSPSSANITQSIYMLISVGVAFVFATSGQRPEFREHFLYASLLGAALLVLSGLIAMGVSDVGREDLLAPFHNATYHLLDTAAIAGQTRVVGFMPEASTFGAACSASLGFLLFNRAAYRGQLRKWIVPSVAIGLTYMTYASTSSGAYIALAVIAIIGVFRFVFDIMFTKRFVPAQLRTLIFVIAAVFASAIIFAILPKSLVNHLSALLDAVIFQKSTSFSYLQRNSWTQAGVAAFWATDGIGVGVGSVRTSNWLVNFAASTGFIGIFLFGSFVLRSLISTKGYPNAKYRQFANGLKLALLPELVVGSLSGTTPDPGAGLLLSLGLIYALRQKPPATVEIPAFRAKRALTVSENELHRPGAGMA